MVACGAALVSYTWVAAAALWASGGVFRPVASRCCIGGVLGERCTNCSPALEIRAPMVFEAIQLRETLDGTIHSFLCCLGNQRNIIASVMSSRFEALRPLSTAPNNKSRRRGGQGKGE